MCGFPSPAEISLEAVSFAALPGFSEDDHLEAFRVFAASSKAILDGEPVLRPGALLPEALKAVCEQAVEKPPRDANEARQFFETFFVPHRIRPGGTTGSGFVTGYYEPVVDGSLVPNGDFTAPILSRPEDLVILPQGSNLEGSEGPLQAARMGPRGLEPYPDRAAIDAGAIRDRAESLVWLRDKAEVFFIQVQGSARIKLPDGSDRRLVYAGRNGHPYTSIGRILITEENIAPEHAGLCGLKQWIRDKGQAEGMPGAALMLRNKSYVFFSLKDVIAPEAGPVGGQGVALSQLRSIALDRAIWPYGVPMWIDAVIPWRSSTPSPFQRLMIGQDTGSAILGAARGDLFFGSGEEAGALAGAIRHPADFAVLLPRGLDRWP